MASVPTTMSTSPITALNDSFSLNTKYENAIVTIILSCEVWMPYLIALITGNKWWWGIGSACWAFWLAPGTPFTIIAVTLTIAIKKLWIKIKRRHK